MSTMKDVSESASRRLEEQRQAVESAHRRAEQSEAALETAWQELAELKKRSVSVDSQLEHRLVEVRRELELSFAERLREQSAQATERETALERAAQELRSGLARLEEQSGWKEDELRHEVRQWQEKCRAAESRAASLASSVADASRPLLRQLDALRQSHAAAQQGWESLEHSLNAQLRQAEERAEHATLSLQDTTEQLGEVRRQLTMHSAQVGGLRDRVAKLASELEQANARADHHQRSFDELRTSSAAAQQQASERSESARQRRLAVEQQLERVQHELQRACSRASAGQCASPAAAAANAGSAVAGNASSVLVGEVDTALSQGHGATSQSSTVTRALAGSLRFGVHSASQPSLSPASSASSSSSSVGSLPSAYLGAGEGSVATAALQRTQLLLSQRERELSALRSELRQTQESRVALEQEIVKMTSHNERLLLTERELHATRSHLHELNVRHGAALELIGEKEERVDELQADLADVKQLYRSQISELLTRLELMENQQQQEKMGVSR
jgi:TATA element modulatory factor